MCSAQEKAAEEASSYGMASRQSRSAQRMSNNEGSREVEKESGRREEYGKREAGLGKGIYAF